MKVVFSLVVRIQVYQFVTHLIANKKQDKNYPLLSIYFDDIYLKFPAANPANLKLNFKFAGLASAFSSILQ
jgi:hypothetical protein